MNAVRGRIREFEIMIAGVEKKEVAIMAKRWKTVIRLGGQLALLKLDTSNYLRSRILLVLERSCNATKP
jgi:hypothetical protein